MAYIDELRRHKEDIEQRMECCESDTAYAQLSRQWLKVASELNEMDEPSDAAMDAIIGDVANVR